MNVRVAYSETSIKTVYHYEKVLKAGDQRDIVWFVSNTCYFIGETLARVRRACKKKFLIYWCNRCSTGCSCSKTNQPLARVSFSFVQKHSFGSFSPLFLRVSNHQLVDKMKLSHLNSDFALTLLAWVILTQL